MVHNPLVKSVIVPVALGGILILAVLTAIPSNNRTFASPTSSQEQTCPDGSIPDASGNCPTSPAPPAGGGETAAAPPATETPPPAEAPPATETPPPAEAPPATETPPPACAPLVSSTCSSTAPPAGASQVSNNTDFVNTILQIHNRERTAVGVPPLVWSDTLAADAQEYADHLAAIGKMEHMWQSASDEWSKKAHGANENLAARGPPGPGTLIPMVESWVAEKQYFDGTLNLYKNGHYTQMIWKATKELGCGMATGSANDFLVCRYLPSGNTGPDPFK